MHVRFDDLGLPYLIARAAFEGSEEVDLPLDYLAGHRRLPDGSWVERDPPPVPPAREIIDIAPEADPKMTGIEFEGVMCSATSQDQAGLMAVLLAIQMQGAGFRPTRFEFENGSELVIHLGNHAALAAVWMPFRQSFFAVQT